MTIFCEEKTCICVHTCFVQGQEKNISMILKQLILSPESVFTNCFMLRWEMTEEHYRKVITKDTDLWDRVYRFDLIKVLLAKTELKDTISFMEMFLTSEPNSFGAILYQ